jgi:hemoglobin
MTEQNINIYEFVGGDAVIRRLVERFYDLVEADAELRPIFPEDLGPGREWQYLFLCQVFGGPEHYIVQRGHPRLRMRHAPFEITAAASQRWLMHMLTSLDELDIKEPAYSAMRTYFENGAAFLVNRVSLKEDDTHGR